MRYELQKKVFEELQSDEVGVEIVPMLSTLPSITEVCMPSLLDSNMSIRASYGGIEVELNGFGISSKADREKWLKNKYGDKIAILNLEELKEFKKEDLEGKQLLVIMDREIDKAGNFISGELLDYFDRLALQLKRGIETVFELGYNRVVVATDHGFLYIPLLNKIETIEAPKKDVYLGRRYALSSTGAKSISGGTLSLQKNQLGYNTDLTAVFPLGISYFSKPGSKEPFIHGGISLQECCIGVLKCFLKRRLEKVGIKVTLPDVISTAIFTLKIGPVIKQISFAPRKVVVELLTEGELIAKSEIVDIYDKTKDVTLKLPMTPKELEVVVKDAETEEILERKTVPVALEGYDDLL